MPKVGAHVSAAISLDLAFDRALAIGAECTQIFISPPQQWLQTKHDSAEIKRYLEKQRQTKIGPNFIHGTYLINLGTNNSEHLQKSISWLIYALNLAEQLGIEGVIFHLGSHRGMGFDKVAKKISDSLIKILEESSSRKTCLILELSAGAGATIGSKFAQLGTIIKMANHPRIKICLDTQHAFAAGYDVKTPLGLKTTIKEFGQEIGLSYLVAIHANDSKVEYLSGKDRHANIGEGFIGKEGFEVIINHPALSKLPFILEVPGFLGTGPDEENITILRSLIQY